MSSFIKILNILWILVLSSFAACDFESGSGKKTVVDDSIDINPTSETPQDSITDEEYFTTENFDILVKKYEDPGRVNWQNPELVLEKLGDLNGMVVADIGAGTGYFTFRMARTADKVIAIDIDQRFLDYIDERKREFPDGGLDNVVTRLTEESSPNLKPNEADVVLMVNTYHFIENRIDYFEKVKNGLAPGGRLIVVDFKEGKIPVGPPDDIKVSPEVVFSELEDAGFQEFQIDQKSLEYQYIIIAK